MKKKPEVKFGVAGLPASPSVGRHPAGRSATARHEHRRLKLSGKFKDVSNLDEVLRHRNTLSFQCQRLFDLISREVYLIREAGANSLAVVVRPDRHTELFLQIQLKSERVEAFVRCVRGDMTVLSRDWDRLREVLRCEGVELAPVQQCLSSRSLDAADALSA